MSNLEDLINITSVAGQSLDLNIFNQEYSARSIGTAALSVGGFLLALTALVIEFISNSNLPSLPTGEEIRRRIYLQEEDEDKLSKRLHKRRLKVPRLDLQKQFQRKRLRFPLNPKRHHRVQNKQTPVHGRKIKEKVENLVENTAVDNIFEETGEKSVLSPKSSRPCYDDERITTTESNLGIFKTDFQDKFSK
ncbi:uncharacterized protein LOC111699692 [Eurytemora carolleeae]|uniref:uncharacterized protein LOC111699692 n=1 Tax=Eurytemora carolleeae TaxID=1294199 RepID=UPI000C792533|nr:uncharacterized protein LOC111699692 [Eurytemora carolleeae]|eukprot:XP_023326184.1 uncharacterized protein LOC111699692 [Eurytemora affinis]